MEAKKALYRKYFPNSQISDANLTILLNSLDKYYPGKDLKAVFREIQQDNVFWSNFKAKYPHADISKFHLDNTDGVRSKECNVFKKTVMSIWSSKQAYAWLNAPNYKYWPQQLNFAVWCATCGCGVSLEELNKWPKIIQGFLKFHVYFTTRRVLYELGVPLPDETAFEKTNNTYTNLES